MSEENSDVTDCSCPFHWPGGHGAMPWEPAARAALRHFGIDGDAADRVVDLLRDERAFEVGPSDPEVAQLWRERAERP